MKDFSELLDDSTKKHFAESISYESLMQQKPISQWELAKIKALKVVAPIALTLVTGPCTTLSILMQVTDKPLVKGQIQSKVNAASSNMKQYAASGILGDNSIFKSFQFSTYSEALKQLAKEGIRGMYKGNLTGLIFAQLNTKLRQFLYQTFIGDSQTASALQQNIVTIATCTFADWVTLPLMLCQSRLVLQNSLPNFRTYKTPVDIIWKTSMSAWFKGSILLLGKNILFSLAWISWFKESPVYSFVASSMLSHVIMYPFLTVLRTLQCCAPGVAMMHDRPPKLMDVARHIVANKGVAGLYRGFLAYGLVHSFMGLIMLEMNVRSGYFDMMN